MLRRGKFAVFGPAAIQLAASCQPCVFFDWIAVRSNCAEIGVQQKEKGAEFWKSCEVNLARRAIFLFQQKFQCLFNGLNLPRGTSGMSMP